MKSHSTVLFASTIFLCFLISSPLVVAQQGAETIYFQTTYRTIPIEREEAFLGFIADVIKPMFAAEVENGRLIGWYMWRVRYVSTGEEYNYIFSRGTSELANLEQTFDGGFESAIVRAHGNVLDEVNSRSQGLGRIVKAELWTQSPISVLQNNANPARWANVAFYQNHIQRDIARDLLLQNVVAQFQLARMTRGISSGWAYFTRRFPFDGPNSYDSAEIIYYDDFGQILGAGIGQQIWQEIRADTTNLSDNMDRLRETRDEVKRELWELIDYVQ